MSQPPELELTLYDETDLLLSNVRIVFPSLFKPAKFKEKETGFEVTCLVPKDDEHSVAMLKAYISQVAQEAGVKVKKGKTFVRDADEEDKEQDYLKGMLLVKGRSPKVPPQVYAGDDQGNLLELDEESAGDKYCYSGSYCNVLLRGWAANHPEAGPRVGAYLLAVQHVADGERLGGVTISQDQVAAAFGAKGVKKAPKLKGGVGPSKPVFPTARGEMTKRSTSPKKVDKELDDFDDIEGEEDPDVDSIAF